MPSQHSFVVTILCSNYRFVIIAKSDNGLVIVLVKWNDNGFVDIYTARPCRITVNRILGFYEFVNAPRCNLCNFVGNDQALAIIGKCMGRRCRNKDLTSQKLVEQRVADLIKYDRRRA